MSIVPYFPGRDFDEYYIGENNQNINLDLQNKYYAMKFLIYHYYPKYIGSYHLLNKI